MKFTKKNKRELRDLHTWWGSLEVGFVTRLAESELTPDIFLCLFPISAKKRMKKKWNL
jgi:hypothetical protein